jgi:hypothetical protein
MRPTTRSTWIFALLLALAPAAEPAFAQADDTEAFDNAPAHIRVIDGSASLEREGRLDRSPQNVPLMAGDRLRTEQGRIEVLFGDGSVLSIDHFTVVDLQSDSLMRLLEGRVRLTVVNGGPVQYRIDAPSATVSIVQPGDYRVSLLSPAADRRDVELIVLRGLAELRNDAGVTAVNAGERALMVEGDAPRPAEPFNVAQWDAFERWVEDQRQARLGVTSSQYLPQELRTYGGAFDQYGSWQVNPTYGFVWYPSVAVGWRPYYGGRWHYYKPYGWTWIGLEPWAWPTHHYGRWGFSSGAWFWIPTKRWGPAWVSWTRAPGFIGWCPRGWDGGPVIGFHHGRRQHPVYDPWRAWTVVPKRSFVHGFAVRRHAVVGTTIPQSAVFVSSAGGPGDLPLPNIAVPRGATPLVSIGRDPYWRGHSTLPGTVPAMPRTGLPSRTSGAVYGAVPGPDEGVQAIPRPGRVRDAGVGGPVHDPSAVPRGDVPQDTDPGATRRHTLPPGYVVPYERAVPRRRADSALPGTVPQMPATPPPAAVDPGPRGGRRHAPPPTAAAPPPSRHSQSAPPPPAPSARSGSEGSGGRERAVPRHGGSQGGSVRGSAPREGGGSGGAPSRRRPG